MRMPYQRGTGSVEVELSRVQTTLEYLDPKMGVMEGRVDVLESFRDTIQGSLRVIIWMNGVVITILVAMILALFGWGLSRITLKVENAPSGPVSGVQSSQESGNSTAYAQR